MSVPSLALRYLMAFVLTVIVALAGLTALAGHGAGAAGLGAWSCDSAPASIAFKAFPWSNSTGLVASALPEPAAYQVANDFQHRAWQVWLYPPGEVHTFWWDEAVVEDAQPGGLPAGRINPTGNPAPYYHDGATKANFVEWDPNGGPGALYRVRFPCHYTP